MTAVTAGLILPGRVAHGRVPARESAHIRGRGSRGEQLQKRDRHSQVKAADGSTEIVVAQVNVVPVSREDDGNIKLVVEAALGTVYDVSMDKHEIATYLRHMADQVEAGS